MFVLRIAKGIVEVSEATGVSPGSSTGDIHKVIGDAGIGGVDAVVGLPNTFLSVYTLVYFPQSTQDQTKLLFEAPRPGGR